jgi:hypothetical protein
MKVLSSWIQRRGVWYKFTDVVEERTASIFRVVARRLLLAGVCLAVSLTLKMEAVCSFETFNFYRPTRRYIPEEIIIVSMLPS